MVPEEPWLWEPGTHFLPVLKAAAGWAWHFLVGSTVSFLPSRDAGHRALLQWQVQSVLPTAQACMAEVIRVVQGLDVLTAIAWGTEGGWP